MTTIIKDIEKAVSVSNATPQEVIDDWAKEGYMTAEEEEYARIHFAKQSAAESLSTNPHEALAESTSSNSPDMSEIIANAKMEASRMGKPFGHRDILQWNRDISPVTNIVAHPLAVFSAGVDKVAEVLRSDDKYPKRTFSENYDLAMEKYQKKNPGNPRNIWDDVAIGGTEMLGEMLATAGIAPTFSIFKNALVNGRKVKQLKDAEKALPLKEAASALRAYAFPQTAQTAKPLMDAAEAVNKLPTLYTNPYFRGAVENAAFASIDPELSNVDAAVNVVAGLGATKALTRMPFLTNRKTREGLIGDGRVGVRQVIDAPKQGPHADSYNDALPWVLENLETRHWQGGGPMKTLQNLEKSADEVMNDALKAEITKNGTQSVPQEVKDKITHQVNNPMTYKTKIAKKAADVEKQLSARNYDAFKNLEKSADDAMENLIKDAPTEHRKIELRKSAFETLSYVYDEAMKLVRSPDPVLRKTGASIIANRDQGLRLFLGDDAAEKVKEALFKKSIADSYGIRINLGEINAAKKDIHQVAKDHIFTPFIKAANLGEGPNALVRAAYPIVKDKRIDWLQSYKEPFEAPRDTTQPF